MPLWTNTQNHDGYSLKRLENVFFWRWMHGKIKFKVNVITFLAFIRLSNNWIQVFPARFNINAHQCGKRTFRKFEISQNSERMCGQNGSINFSQSIIFNFFRRFLVVFNRISCPHFPILRPVVQNLGAYMRAFRESQCGRSEIKVQKNVIKFVINSLKFHNLQVDTSPLKNTKCALYY